MHNRREIPVLLDDDCRAIPICMLTLNGIQTIAAKRGYKIKIYESCERLLAYTRDNDRVIVVGFESAQLPLMLQQLKAARRHAVVTGMDADHIDAHYSCATFSRRIATEQLLDFLYEKGCRRFALVGCGNRSVNDVVHNDAMAKHLDKYIDQTEGQCFWYHTCIEESFQPFLEQWQEFDAVLCPNDYVAVALLKVCEKMGLRVPDSFLLASFKGNRLSRYCKPGITTLDVDFDAIGMNSVMVWIFLQELPAERQQLRITVPGRVNARESTGALRNAAGTPRSAAMLHERYEGGPFYKEPTLQALMRIERCLQSCDELDLNILGRLLHNSSYERIAEDVFLSDSSLQYRIRKLFKTAEVKTRHDFLELFQANYTHNNSF